MSTITMNSTITYHSLYFICINLIAYLLTTVSLFLLKYSIVVITSAGICITSSERGNSTKHNTLIHLLSVRACKQYNNVTIVTLYLGKKD